MDFNSLILTNLSPVLSYVNFIYINYSHRWLIVPNTFDIHKTLHADKGCMQRLCLSGPILYTPIDYQLPELNIDWTFKCRSFWMNWLTYFCHYRQSIDTKEIHSGFIDSNSSSVSILKMICTNVYIYIYTCNISAFVRSHNLQTDI